MSFKPPNGQSCANCALFAYQTETGGFCFANASHKTADEYSGREKDDWCGHWRGNAETRCGACKWQAHPDDRCPRAFAFYFGASWCMSRPFPDAFSCERWEDAP